jgi:hypothetical protein
MPDGSGSEFSDGYLLRGKWARQGQLGRTLAFLRLSYGESTVECIFDVMIRSRTSIETLIGMSVLWLRNRSCLDARLRQKEARRILFGVNNIA